MGNEHDPPPQEDPLPGSTQQDWASGGSGQQDLGGNRLPNNGELWKISRDHRRLHDPSRLVTTLVQHPSTNEEDPQLSPSLRQSVVSPNGPPFPVRTPAETVSSLFTEPSDEPLCIFGPNLFGLVRMASHPCPVELQPLKWNDSEKYLEQEWAYSHLTHPYGLSISLSQLDLQYRTCWRYQQSFGRNILSWFPIFDQRFCVDVVQRSSASGFQPSELTTCLSLFILALGAITRSEDDTTEKLNPATPGLAYFQLASQQLNSSPSASSDILGAQCYVLKS